MDSNTSLTNADDLLGWSGEDQEGEDDQFFGWREMIERYWHHVTAYDGLEASCSTDTSA